MTYNNYTATCVNCFDLQEVWRLVHILTAPIPRPCSKMRESWMGLLQEDRRGASISLKQLNLSGQQCGRVLRSFHLSFEKVGTTLV
jgi:hypothetical protein